MKHYLGRLIGTRPTWPHDMSEAEGEVMGAHFAYLQGLVEQSEALLTADPGVGAGLHRFEFDEFKLSLWAGKASA